MANQEASSRAGNDLSQLFRENIAVWLRVHASSEWRSDSEAVVRLADRLVWLSENGEAVARNATAALSDSSPSRDEHVNEHAPLRPKSTQKGL